MKSVRTYLVLGGLGVSALLMRSSRRDRLSRPLIAAVTIDRPPLEVYAAYRRLQSQLASYVEAADGGPAAVELVEDRPGELLAWRSAEGAGSVAFFRGPGGDSTEVQISLELGPIGRVLVAPRVRADLARFKQMVEDSALRRREWRQPAPPDRSVDHTPVIAIPRLRAAHKIA